MRHVDVYVGGSAELTCAVALEVPVSCEVRASGLGKRTRRVLLRARPASWDEGGFSPLAEGGFRQRAKVKPDDGGTALAVLVGVVSFPESLVQSESPAGCVIVEARRSLTFLIWLIPACVLAVCAAAFALLLLTNPWTDPHMVSGDYEGKSTAEIQRDLNEATAWYSMVISCSPTAVISPGSDMARGINIENVSANHCDQKATLALKDTGEVLFESGAISPGGYIPDAKLARSLDEGIYEAVVTFQGYELHGRFGGGGQIWGHDEFGSPSKMEMLLIVTDDEDYAQEVAKNYAR